MTIQPHKPGATTFSVWQNAPFEIAFIVKDGGVPVNLASAVVGLTMTGLEGGASLTLRSDAPGPQTINDEGSHLQITNAAGGQVTLILGATDARKVRVGQMGEWRLWLASGGGEVPMKYGRLQGLGAAKAED